jgi:signal transduction histidine kinase
MSAEDPTRRESTAESPSDEEITQPLDGPTLQSAESPAPRLDPAVLAQRETLPLARPPADPQAGQGSREYETAEVPSVGFDNPGEFSVWNSPLWQRRSSFFRQVFFWLLGMALFMSLGSGAVFYNQQYRFLEQDQRQRSSLLLGALASQCQMGAYASDRAILSQPVQRMAQIDDVEFVAVYDSQGGELLKTNTRTGTHMSDPPPAKLRAYLADVVLQTVKNVPSRQTRDALDWGLWTKPLEERHETYIDLYAPILLSDRNPAGLTAFTNPLDSGVRDRVVGIVRLGLSIEPAQERLRQVLVFSVGLGVVLMALGVVAALLIAGRLSGPIMALARGADEIRSGNLHPRINVRRSDELGLLADSFVRMAERLRESMQALSQLNRNLESEIKRRTKQLRLAYAFTSVLNSPIDRSGDAMDAADLTVMLDQALAALVEATATRGGGVFLIEDGASGEPELLVRAAYGVSTHKLGTPPAVRDFMSPDSRPSGAPSIALSEAVKVQGRRILVPLTFRNQPLGLLVLVMTSEEMPDGSLLEFVRQAAAQLSIAVSNARAYARVGRLAHELVLHNEALALQRDQMQQQRDQLAQQRNQLAEQRDQLEQQSFQLRIQRNQLREVNRLKSEFLANVSHELRTPLNAIMGYTELIRDGVYGAITGDAYDATDGVLASSANLLRLINQILDLSRIEAGKMDVHRESVDLAVLVAAVIKEAEAMGRDRPYRVQLVCPRDLRIDTDPAKLQQILTNLVANAIKFTSQGSVTVEVTADSADYVTISVIDTGIGIRPEHLEIIFEEFRQVDGSSTRRFGGTGLGLAIARRLAEMLGGVLEVRSAFGVGSTFSLRIPRTGRIARPSQRRSVEMDSNPSIDAPHHLQGVRE